VLRITIEPGAGERPSRVKLEGRLVGPWVDELRRVTRPLGSRLDLDLSALTFADPEGAALIRQLRQAGAVFSGASPVVEPLLERGDR
jgi:hypothetical protein